MLPYWSWYTFYTVRGRGRDEYVSLQARVFRNSRLVFKLERGTPGGGYMATPVSDDYEEALTCFEAMAYAMLVQCGAEDRFRTIG